MTHLKSTTGLNRDKHVAYQKEKKKARKSIAKYNLLKFTQNV